MFNEQKSIFAAKTTWIALIASLVCMAGSVWLDQLSEEHELVIQNQLVPSQNFINGATNTPPFTMVNFPQRSEIASWERAGSNLLMTLGLGILVAVFFIKPLENRWHEERMKAEEELRKNIQEDVVAATMGKLLPSRIFEAVKRDVLEPGFVATKARWEISFQILPDKRVRSLTHMFYQILNTRETEHEEKRETTIKPTEEGKVCSSLIRVEGKEIIDTTKNLGNCEILQEGSTYKIISRFKVPGRGRAESIAIYEEFYKGPVMETMFLSYPTEELEISVQFPDGWHFELPSFISLPIERYHQTATTCHYRFTGALLPYQAVLYTLTPPSETHKRDSTGTFGSRNEEITTAE